MFATLFKTLDQFFEPAFWRVLAKTTLISIILLALSIWLGFQLVDYIPDANWDWVNWIVDNLAFVGVVVAMVIIYPALANMVAGLFLDDVAEAVEQRHYAADPPGIAVGIRTSMWSATKLAGWMLLVNLLALPFYIIFLFIPGLSLVLYYIINGWLLNKEYFELIAQRHGDEAQHQQLRRKHGGRLFLWGCVIAFVFTVPILNLAAPLLATGMMVHVFKDLAARNAPM